MKLLNRSLWMISLASLVIIGIWATVFYFEMIDEIEEGVNEGLDHYKQQIIFQAHRDSTVLGQANFNHGFYSIQEIPAEKALRFRDIYSDTLIKIIDAKENRFKPEPFRVLTTAFENKGQYYRLKVINSMVEKDDLLDNFLHTLIFLYIVLIISIILINNLALRKVWNPFYKFLGQLKGYRINQRMPFPKVKTNTAEFKDLQASIHTLLNRNHQLFEQQKRFIGNASHELQTPLAISLNKLELLLEKGDLQSEDIKSIGETMAIIERLIRLNKSLLLLSRIENNQFPAFEEISIQSLVNSQINELSEISAFKKVTISTDFQYDTHLKINPSLAETLIGNLLRNALFHNLKNGTIKIVLSTDSLKIGNTGSTQSLPSNFIFERFYKSDQNENNTGLGLSIVKAICNLYQYEITYRYHQHLHWFQIKFS